MTWLDLRDPSTTPLNFTKSINLALSERGINAMRHAGQPKLIEHVMGATIPMRGRMIHGKRVNGDFYEESQDYDAHGRVRAVFFRSLESGTDRRHSPSSPSTAAV
jgi:kynurenine 3-monooxygenase